MQGNKKYNSKILTDKEINTLLSPPKRVLMKEIKKLKTQLAKYKKLAEHKKLKKIYANEESCNFKGE